MDFIFVCVKLVVLMLGEEMRRCVVLGDVLCIPAIATERQVRVCKHASLCACVCVSTLLCKQAVKFNYLPPPLPRSVGVPAERGSASTEPFPWETLAHSG